VGSHHHSIGLLGWTKVVGKAPGSDHSKLGMRDGALNHDTGSGGELDWSGLDEHHSSIRSAYIFACMREIA
jgi:hypothetical protein